MSVAAATAATTTAKTAAGPTTFTDVKIEKATARRRTTRPAQRHRARDSRGRSSVSGRVPFGMGEMLANAGGGPARKGDSGSAAVEQGEPGPPSCPRSARPPVPVHPGAGAIGIGSAGMPPGPVTDPERRSPTDVADAEIRALSAGWLARIDRLADGMYAHLRERITVLDAHPELHGLTRASCSSNVETILSMLANGIPSSATEAPVTALEHARAMATVGAEVDDTLRFYRLGHGWFLERWTTALSERIGDRDALLAGLASTAAFALEYIDVVSTRVSAEHLAERERRQRRAVVLRGDLVRALLGGEEVDVAAAERTLGHRFAGPQTAFVCWSTREGPELERVAAAVAEALGPGRPLLVLESPRVLGGWVSSPAAPVDREALTAAARAAGPHVGVALGGTRPGLDGFVASRREADRARRVAGLLRERPPAVWFQDVAALDLLTADLPAARAFVRGELGELARDDEATAAVRRTALAVIAPRGGVMAAARELDLHRNTVLQRLHRAETLRGAPVAERSEELFLALTLACGLDPAVPAAPAAEADVPNAHRVVPDAH